MCLNSSISLASAALPLINDMIFSAVSLLSVGCCAPCYWSPIKSEIHYSTFKNWTDCKNTRKHTLANFVKCYREKTSIALRIWHYHFHNKLAWKCALFLGDVGQMKTIVLKLCTKIGSKLKTFNLLRLDGTVEGKKSI